MDLGEEIRNARLMSGTSQTAVAAAAHVSRSTVSRLESAQLGNASIVEAVIVADAAGLDLSIRAYVGRQPTRDAGHARRLIRFLRLVAPPLAYRTEVQLPSRGGKREQRAWDAVIFGDGGQTGVELEQRLHDMQAQTRRLFAKWRDSGADRLLLLIADTRHNREVIATFADYLAALPRLDKASVLGELAAGRRPPSGWLFH